MVKGNVLYDSGADKGFDSPAFLKVLKDVKSKPIYTHQATIRAIDGSTLQITDLKIHRIMEIIPVFGPFHAHLGEIPIEDADLVLGSGC
jgi:pantothenate kinase